MMQVHIQNCPGRLVDDNHNSVTKTARVAVNKVDSNLTVGDMTFDYGSTGTNIVSFTGASGVTASVDSDKAIVNAAGNVITVSGLDIGTYNLTVTTIPDDNHYAVTKTARVAVNKIDSTLAVGDIAFDYGSFGTATVSYTGAGGVTATVNNAKVAVNVNGNVITVSGLDVGTYTLSVTTMPDNNHNAVTKTSTITVNKAPDNTNPSQNTNTKNKKTKTTLTLKKVKVEKSAKKLVIKATLKINKKAAKGKKIKFKFNKKTYRAKTNKKGVEKA